MQLGYITQISAFDRSRETPGTISGAMMHPDIFRLNMPIKVKADNLVIRVVTKDEQKRRVTFFLYRESK